MLVDTSWMTGSSGGSGNIDAAIFPLSDYFKVSIEDSTDGGLPGTADQHDDSLFGMAYMVGDRTFIRPFGSVAAKWKANSADSMMLRKFRLRFSPGMYGDEERLFSNSMVLLLSGSQTDPSAATSDDNSLVSPFPLYNEPDKVYDEGDVWGFTIGGVGDLEVDASGYDLDYQKGSVERFFIDRCHQRNAVGDEGYVVGFADKYTLGDKTWVDFNGTIAAGWGEPSSGLQPNAACFQLPEELWPSEDRCEIGRYSNGRYATFVVITKTGYVYTPGVTFLSGSHDTSSPSTISDVMSDRARFQPESFSYLL